MQDKIDRMGLDAFVDSAGFESYHIGEGADPRSEDIARKNGVSLDGHSARQFRKDDFDRFDRIYVMDETNYRDVAGVARDKNDLDKVDYIMNTVAPGSNSPVPDPYYGGKEGFSNVYKMLDAACDTIAQEIKRNGK
jgi:protein-tyrosine phosphatase